MNKSMCSGFIERENCNCVLLSKIGNQLRLRSLCEFSPISSQHSKCTPQLLTTQSSLVLSHYTMWLHFNCPPSPPLRCALRLLPLHVKRKRRLKQRTEEMDVSEKERVCHKRTISTDQTTKQTLLTL